MLDWHRITGFDWDEGNSQKILLKHGVTLAEVEQALLNEPLVVTPDVQHSRDETRFHALGHTDEGKLLHLVFTLRQNGTLLRVISARDMSKKERQRYEEET
jgi:uncharacterized DUF497 family protein